MDFKMIETYFPWYVRGFGTTLQLGLSAIFIGLVIGILIAIMRTVKFKPFNWIGQAYTSIFQGTPLLLQIIFIYYTLPEIDIVLSATMSGILALSLNVGANFGETIRGGIIGIPRGQFDAAKALGYGYGQMMFRIILPQTVRVILPSISSFAVLIMKDTSLVSVIALEELMRVSQLVRASTFKSAESFIIAAVFYYVLIFGMKKLFDALEAKTKKY